MIIDEAFLDSLAAAAKESPRLRANYDLRTSAADTSQRMLNALEPGTLVPVHRHPNSTETVLCLRGRMDEVLYSEDGLREVERIHLCPSDGAFGCQVPAGAWHTVEVLESGTVILEAKDGAYGKDGSEQARLLHHEPWSSSPKNTAKR